MGNDGAFGFDAEDLDRVIREASEGLRAAFDRFAGGFTSGNRGGWGRDLRRPGSGGALGAADHWRDR